MQRPLVSRYNWRHRMSAKQVFLSHSSHDAVLTRLLGHVLEQEGLACFYSERDIPVGKEFDEKIISTIHGCDVLLVVWTSHAAASPWVNQEIGIAIAKNIPVWPLAIDATTIQGAMFRRQGSLLNQDPDPHAAIVRLATEIKKISGDRPFAPHVDHFLVGKEQRTRQLVELLRSENSRRVDQYTLRIQAAFSCFAISPDPAYRVSGYHTADYHNLLVNERQEVERMAQWATLRIIIWPQRPYDDAFMQVRFRNLLSFLRTGSSFTDTRVVLGRYHGGNRYVLDRNALVTGIKGPAANQPGYELTTITYHGPTIGSAIREFDQQFEEFWVEHAKACKADDPTSINAHVIERLEGMAPVGAKKTTAS